MKSKSLFCLTPLVFSSVGAVAAITGISLLNQNTPNKIKIVDIKYLDISDDHKTLYGFKTDINVQELIDEQYNTLAIPDYIERIEDYAFCSIFDELNINIKNIYLQDSIKYIGNYAFYHCFSVQYVSFDKLSSNSVLETIGNHCFDSCNLECDIILPSTLLEICDGAFFKGIVGPTKIIFPSKLNYVGNQAFAECPKISALNFRSCSQMPEWLMKQNAIFKNSASEVSYVELYASSKIDSESDWIENISTKQALTKQTSIILNETKKTVPNEAFITESRSEEVHGETVWHLWLVDFDYDNYLDELDSCDEFVIPDGIEYIDDDIFYSDKPIKSPHAKLFLPSSLIGIGSNAFRSCKWLEGDLSIPSTVTSIGHDAFHECHFNGFLNLTSESQYRYEIEIGDKAFGFNFFTGVIFDSNVVFGDDCFMENYDLHVIDLSTIKPGDTPNEDRGESVFPDQECGTIIWPNEGKPERYGKWQDYFEDIGLEGRLDNGRWVETTQPLDEPTDVTSFITGSNYENVYGLSEGGKRADETTITFHTNTRAIKPGAFNDEFDLNDDDPKSIKTLHFNKGLKTIGNKAFYDCSGVSNTELEFPRTITEIGDEAFKNNTNLMVDLQLPQQVERIGDSAFEGCTEVISRRLTIPSSTKYIGSLAFSGLKFVNTLVFRELDDKITIGEKAFSDFKYLDVVDFSNWGDTPPVDKVIVPTSNNAFNLNDAKLGKVSTSKSSKIIYIAPNADKDQWKAFLETQLGFELTAEIDNPWTLLHLGEGTERSNYE